VLSLFSFFDFGHPSSSYDVANHEVSFTLNYSGELSRFRFSICFELTICLFHHDILYQLDLCLVHGFLEKKKHYSEGGVSNLPRMTPLVAAQSHFP
jgi:hypothetical protein